MGVDDIAEQQLGAGIENFDGHAFHLRLGAPGLTHFLQEGNRFVVSGE